MYIRNRQILLCIPVAVIALEQCVTRNTSPAVLTAAVAFMFTAFAMIHGHEI